VESGEGIERYEYGPESGYPYVPTVESGEGIESSDSERRGGRGDAEVESGEGIERLGFLTKDVYADLIGGIR